MTSTECVYEVNQKGRIVSASDEFCRALRCTRPVLMGRDVRDLLRPDFRADFRTFVARALVGIGEAEIMVPMVAPCGERGWFKHAIEPIVDGGRITGYRALVVPPQMKHARARRWWQWSAPEPRLVWNFETANKAS
jgi:PAS domain S-box-containing protein